MSHSPDHSATSLYCTEDAGDVVSSHANTRISDPPSSSSALFPPSNETTISRLIDSEAHHMPQPDYLRYFRDRSIDLTARQDSIKWILKVQAHYQFRPVTAVLSVNYFDRFLSRHSLSAIGWPFQLLSVACLSLAAKMEEPYVPLLIDLQVFEPRFIFEPKTVQRMELWVMANLDWRLRSVTPFDFLDCLIPNLPGLGSKSALFDRVLSTSSDLILNSTRVVDFLGFPPSIIAAAAVISAAGDNVDFPADADWLPKPFYERVNKEMVRSCHQLMEEFLIDTCPSSDLKDRRVQPAPPNSPIGVLDAAACGSCDTRSGNPVAASGSGSGSNEAELPNKRLRSSTSDVQQEQA
ncbi:hypothetical protein F0562_028763 [Nyssa sinensis]|uniref:Uncharacterized protein n=1 Tax=Nyssa sinensis TaxID=561372 RepID=A0A5J5AZ21_9ASTE|nr:hypothetical protein F0562_028763 [Nyssa sinensis]